MYFIYSVDPRWIQNRPVREPPFRTVLFDTCVDSIPFELQVGSPPAHPLFLCSSKRVSTSAVSKVEVDYDNYIFLAP